jgi:dimethylargininase
MTALPPTHPANSHVYRYGAFTHAIVRPPTANFADGLTTVDLGVPDYRQALAAHAEYCRTLEACGLALTCLPPDERYPDATFVEDTAVLTPHAALLTRPGAPSRAGEVEAIARVVEPFFARVEQIAAPGTLDGGDICEAEPPGGRNAAADPGAPDRQLAGSPAAPHYLIGISARTNEEGAAQLARFLAREGCTCACIDIRQTPGILHLKSGLAYLGDNRMVVIDALADHPALRGYDLIRVAPEEEYAANCVRVNDCVLFPRGYPRLAADLRAFGCTLVELPMTEFQKMDGGLSCLSLRF